MPPLGRAPPEAIGALIQIYGADFGRSDEKLNSSLGVNHRRPSNSRLADYLDFSKFAPTTRPPAPNLWTRPLNSTLDGRGFWALPLWIWGQSGGGSQRC